MAEAVINRIIKIILIVLVLVFAIWGIFQLNAGETIRDLFPDFTEQELQIKYNGQEKIDSPINVGYVLSGKDANIELWYDSSEGEWKWTTDETSKWLRAESARFHNLVKDELENKEFLLELSGKTPEEGLKLIVERAVRLEKEGILSSSPSLKVYAEVIEEGITKSRKELPFETSDKNLQDLDFLIIRINQLTKEVRRESQNQ